MKDSYIRSLAKGISWRLLATLDTLIIAFLFFNSLQIAIPIAATEIFTKLILYYVHERGWNLISWGRMANAPTHLRSTAKGISWRIIGSFDTICISYFYTGNQTVSFKVGTSEVFTKVALFYFHERLWSQIAWGRMY
jgi:uncharacterized membrane protein